MTATLAESVNFHAVAVPLAVNTDCQIKENGMIHKNRGNRRWIDKRKRRHKYNLCQRICGDAMYWLGGILGRYDKGKIHSTDNWKKTNGKVAQSDCSHNTGYVGTLHRMDNNYSHSDKKKVECCNSKLKDYDNGWHEIDTMIIADCEDYADSEGEKND